MRYALAIVYLMLMPFLLLVAVVYALLQRPYEPDRETTPQQNKTSIP
jgi:hypothetical protein